MTLYERDLPTQYERHWNIIPATIYVMKLPYKVSL